MEDKIKSLIQPIIEANGLLLDSTPKITIYTSDLYVEEFTVSPTNCVIGICENGLIDKNYYFNNSDYYQSHYLSPFQDAFNSSLSEAEAFKLYTEIKANNRDGSTSYFYNFNFDVTHFQRVKEGLDANSNAYKVYTIPGIEVTVNA